MSEREIRDAIRQVCESLELKARAQARRRGYKLVFPLVLGAGLVVSCGDETSEPQPDYGAPAGTQTGTTPTGTSTGSITSTGGVGGAGGGGGGALGGGAQVDYMAPDP